MILEAANKLKKVTDELYDLKRSKQIETVVLQSDIAALNKQLDIIDGLKRKIDALRGIEIHRVGHKKELATVINKLDRSNPDVNGALTALRGLHRHFSKVDLLEAVDAIKVSFLSATYDVKGKQSKVIVKCKFPNIASIKHLNLDHISIRTRILDLEKGTHVLSLVDDGRFLDCCIYKGVLNESDTILLQFKGNSKDLNHAHPYVFEVYAHIEGWEEVLIAERKLKEHFFANSAANENTM